jgi:hypothetical protein
MKSKTEHSFSLPTAAIGFKPEFLDFRRGIHVGNLEENERITRILKLALEARYRQGFVTERWGRGVFWQWIGFLPRANREAKPISSKVSFGCSKFFIYVDTNAKLFKCGLQVERGCVQAASDSKQFELRPDWDWHRLVKGLRTGSPLERELRRLLLKEGFSMCAGSWESQREVYSEQNPPVTAKLRRSIDAIPKDKWAGFQLYYPMTESDVMGSTGVDLVESMLAIFSEVTPLMNMTMQIQLELAKS